MEFIVHKNIKVNNIKKSIKTKRQIIILVWGSFIDNLIRKLFNKFSIAILKPSIFINAFPAHKGTDRVYFPPLEDGMQDPSINIPLFYGKSKLFHFTFESIFSIHEIRQIILFRVTKFISHWTQMGQSLFLLNCVVFLNAGEYVKCQ